MNPPESWLQRSYQQGLFQSPLRGTRGQEIDIIQRGEANPWDGPDFLGATIAVDGVRYHGDVEIHIHPRDWFTHGHDLDQRYRQVILHLCWEGAVPPSLDGRFVHAALREQLRLPLPLWRERMRTLDSPSIAAPPTPCGAPSAAQLARLAEARFLRHARALRTHAREFGWEAACLVSLAETLGYRRNRQVMKQLLQQAPPEMLYSRLPAGHRSPARFWLFWALKAGLLPLSLGNSHSASRKWPEALRAEIELVKNAAGAAILAPTAWHFSGSRPLNTPPWRLAAMAQIVYSLGQRALFAQLQAMAARRRRLASLLNSWEEVLCPPLDLKLATMITTIYSHRQAPRRALGSLRMRQFLVNALLPLLHAWASHSGEWGFRIYLESLYEQFPPCEDPQFLKRHLASMPVRLQTHLRRSGFLQQGYLEYLGRRSNLPTFPGGLQPLSGQKEKKGLPEIPF